MGRGGAGSSGAQAGCSAQARTCAARGPCAPRPPSHPLPFLSTSRPRLVASQSPRGSAGKLRIAASSPVAGLNESFVAPRLPPPPRLRLGRRHSYFASLSLGRPCQTQPSHAAASLRASPCHSTPVSALFASRPAPPPRGRPLVGLASRAGALRARGGRLQCGADPGPFLAPCNAREPRGAWAAGWVGWERAGRWGSSERRPLQEW